MCMFCRSLFVLLYCFLLVIVLSVLHRFTDSDYPLGILKLFLPVEKIMNYWKLDIVWLWTYLWKVISYLCCYYITMTWSCWGTLHWFVLPDVKRLVFRIGTFCSLNCCHLEYLIIVRPLPSRSYLSAELMFVRTCNNILNIRQWLNYFRWYDKCWPMIWYIIVSQWILLSQKYFADVNGRVWRYQRGNQNP